MKNKKIQTESHRYKSSFTGEFVQGHQYIAEILTDREAKKNNTTLTYKYWSSDPYWSKIFKKNVTLVGKYAKIYSIEAISNVIKRETWCYSILPLLQKIKFEQTKLDQQTTIVKGEEKPNNIIDITKRKKGLFKLDG